MKQCRTCEFWQVTQKEKDFWGSIITPLDADNWDPMEMPFEVRFCRSPKLQRFERPIETDRATVVDGSKFYAAFVTGPDFGCIHHEDA